MSLLQIVLYSFVAEMVELFLQYAPTLGGVISRLYGYYRRSVFLFLAVHTGYLYILYISLKLDTLDWVMVFIIALKTFDIFTKIEMIRRIYLKKETDPSMRQMMDMPVPTWLFLIGPLTYPWLLYVAFSQ